MPDRYRDYAPGAVIWPTWTDAFETMLSNYVGPSFRLLPTSDGLGVTVSAGANDAAACMAIRGKPRWITAPVTGLHPGGAAGAYGVYAATYADSFSIVPGPPVHESQDNPMDFWLEVLAPGVAPSDAAFYRRVGTCYWTGAVVTAVTTDVGPWAASAPYVTKLPKNPVDGMAVRLLARGPAQPVLWHMRYRQSISKWTFLGGAWLDAKGSGTTTFAAGTPANFWQSTGVGVVAPAAGEYDIDFKGLLYTASPGAAGQPTLGPGIGASVPAAANCLACSSSRVTLSRCVRVSGVAAGAPVTLWVTNDAQTTGVGVMQPHIAIIPHTLDPA